MHPFDTAAGTPLEAPISFTRAGALAGARRAGPIALAVFAYGLVFGVLARQAHLSLLEALLMSGVVFAGSAQFVALGLWSAPHLSLPIAAIVGATLVINLRLLLMGAALRPWFTRLSPLAAYVSVFFMADENWALTMADFARGGRDGAFLLGSGLTVFVAWLSATFVGSILGDTVGDPTRFGLDFAFTAVFIALLAGLWRGKGDAPPWVVAAAVAIVGAYLLPGKWYILLGGVAGSLVGAWRYDR
jgi:4-azaleucine resistance transporter AzlC